jgi:hypothetical protein
VQTPWERSRKVRTRRVDDGVWESMSATQSWKRWRLRRKPGRFPMMGYDCGHGVLDGDDSELERNLKMMMMMKKQRDKESKG